MNGDVPLLSLDPSADGVSYAPVLHSGGVWTQIRRLSKTWR
jgi:hypothetical protein